MKYVDCPRMEGLSLTMFPEQLQLAAGCTRSVFLSTMQSRKTISGVTGACMEVPTSSLASDTLVAMPNVAAQDDEGTSTKPRKLRVWVPDRIFECWRDTMFPSFSPLAAGPQVCTVALAQSPVVL